MLAKAISRRADENSRWLSRLIPMRSCAKGFADTPQHSARERPFCKLADRLLPVLNRKSSAGRHSCELGGNAVVTTRFRPSYWPSLGRPRLGVNFQRQMPWLRGFSSEFPAILQLQFPRNWT